VARTDVICELHYRPFIRSRAAFLHSMISTRIEILESTATYMPRTKKSTSTLPALPAVFVIEQSNLS
jgi:hypothetical protein